MSNTESHPEIGVDSPDRLQFGVFVALLLHAVLIFGVGFGWQKQLHRENPLEFTLVSSAVADENEVNSAEILAQSSQLGGGAGDTTQEATIEASPFKEAARANQLELGSDLDFKETANAGEETLSSASSSFDSVNPEKSELENDPQERLLQIQSQRNELMARISEKEKELESMRRETIVDQASLQAAASPEAEYILGVESRIEAIGTSHFPQEALQKGISGSVSILISIRHDGALENVELTRSSGYPLLDQAAIEIARLAAPFAPFPVSLEQDRDLIHFLRVWRFTTSGSVNTE